MNSQLESVAAKINALKLRERALLALTLLVVLSLGWWNIFAEPAMLETANLVEQNQRISREVAQTRAAIQEIRTTIAAGVNRDKEIQLVQLERALQAVEERLRLKTIELIDPEKMFRLMSQLVYKDSKLKLLSLKRREVRPAIELADGQTDEAGIYRHVLEASFSGKFDDIYNYMRTLEGLDWKLIWDEIEVVRQDYPTITVKVVISTLSTRKEWVGV